MKRKKERKECRERGKNRKKPTKAAEKFLSTTESGEAHTPGGL